MFKFYCFSSTFLRGMSSISLNIFTILAVPIITAKAQIGRFIYSLPFVIILYSPLISFGRSTGTFLKPKNCSFHNRNFRVIKNQWVLDMSEKGAIFIDRGYLSEILKNQFNGEKLDYLKLCNGICAELSLDRLRTYVYTCVPIVRNNSLQDIERKSRAQKFLTKLRRLPRFEIKLGKLQVIGSQFRQKMIDVLMSLDIATMSYEEQIQHAILIAGDSDFIPAIKKAKDYGVIIHLYYHHSSVHNDLLDEVDELDEITGELVSSCKI